MSYILALDTASDYCSVALMNPSEPSSQLLEIRRHAPRQHTQLLLPMVDELLKQANITRKDLIAIAFGAGPGSFTGLRICFAVVQGLAFGLDIPVIPVSTLAAMANAQHQQLLDKPLEQALSEDALYFSCLDARMNQVYWGGYRFDGRKLIALQDDALDDPAAALEKMQMLAKQAQSQKPTKLYCGGPGWHYPELNVFSQQATGLDQNIEPWAGDVLTIACREWADGVAENIRQVQPVYLRNEISWEKRKRIRQP
ncbi:tRNA (adenosine(37)-N6)-threonylcarbamoyltransferase complex dimerization subunit type 1 TsaB [uncultured Pseudoteredinibacter sp.]|uniref:tRNA (adenosine(37)-N6)-threonylcarbamoyltransferase complex dimerization subunit type 1 TsaB n=1 Tax=uncultured Pseudoteredinibacter sp. TaxID=1641701 RepID=UPI00260A569D|nr:tRNA (adenosine(37)-N6)-threonylcarbamoyltransferase complex dimerization subunit type 1 TsaB [uncultured Pseudoteredinibacter sp.]